MSRTRPTRPVLVLLAAVVSACQSLGTEPVATGVDLDALFRPATAAEIAAVEAEWRTRDVSAREIVEEGASALALAGGPGTVRVFSHEVDGHRHYGATIVPAGAAPGSLPVVVIAHSGETGVDVHGVAARLALMGERARGFAYVVPSFRAEPLVANGTVYRSGGAPSPWDRDVDDALAFLQVALERTPEADPERIGALGTSRGATVALLMAVRDPRIALVSEMAGPTDLFDPWMRELTEEALRGEGRPLVGFHVIDQRFIQPLARGAITPARFRLELVRRSPVLWASRLPAVQLHHGTADEVVPVSQARHFIDALARLDRTVQMDEFHLYEGTGHDTLRFSHPLTAAFLERLRR